MAIVSVIVPVYNSQEFLLECINSISNQTLQDIEVICVDDGSTDSSLEILSQLRERDSRIQIYTQENSGAGIARNLGMRHATGTYLSFLDSDDVFEPNMLELMVKAAQQDDLDVLVCRADRFDTKTKEVEPLSWNFISDWLPSRGPFSSDEVQHNFFEAFIWWPWDKLFRRSFIESIHIEFQGVRTTNDLFFVCAAMLLASKIGYIDDILVHQRVGVTSSLSSTREKSWDNYLKALQALHDFLVDRNIYDEYKQGFINYCLNFTMWHLDTIKGTSFTSLYRALQDTWFKNLGVYGPPQEYFYNDENYERLETIMRLGPEEYLFNKIESLDIKVKSLENENNTLIYQVGCLEADKQALYQDKEQLRVEHDALNDLYNKSERNNEEKQAEIQSLVETMNRQQDEIQQLVSDLNSAWNSVSMKIGRGITWGARKLRDGLK